MIFSHEVAAISSMCVEGQRDSFDDDDDQDSCIHARIGADTIGVAYSTKEIHTLKTRLLSFHKIVTSSHGCALVVVDLLASLPF